MARSIIEIGPGDFVKTGPGTYEEIDHIEKVFKEGRTNLPKSWTVVTKNGRRVDMFEALSYYKKEDIKR